MRAAVGVAAGVAAGAAVGAAADAAVSLCKDVAGWGRGVQP